MLRKAFQIKLSRVIFVTDYHFNHQNPGQV
jgi:hypothetical protein